MPFAERNNMASEAVHLFAQSKPKELRTFLSTCDGFAAISPSKEDKLYIKAHWSHALNVKVLAPVEPSVTKLMILLENYLLMRQ